MENFQSITKAIESIKKPILIYSSISIAIYIVIGLIFVSIAQNKEDHSLSSIETCFYGMESIFNNNPKHELLNDSVLRDLQKNKTQFNVDHIHLIKRINNYECDVFSKDSEGVRRFSIKLEKNSKFIHLFKILDISERKVTSRYQL